MKISNSKKQLARIVNENGGWRDGEFSVQNGGHGRISFAKNRPTRFGPTGWFADGGFAAKIECCVPLPANWHQTILSRAEYFHLYPATDADGWIEWNGGDVSPVAKGVAVDVKMKNGTEHYGQLLSNDCWHGSWGDASVIAYRLHKPERAKPELCESVIRSNPEPEAKHTIEKLAADYRNANDYAKLKRQEADDAKDDAEAKLAELVAAGKVLGLLVSPIAAHNNKVIA